MAVPAGHGGIGGTGNDGGVTGSGGPGSDGGGPTDGGTPDAGPRTWPPPRPGYMNPILGENQLTGDSNWNIYLVDGGPGSLRAIRP